MFFAVCATVYSYAQALQVPVFDSVTVVNGKTVLTWQLHPDNTVQGYVLYRYDVANNNNFIIDTVLGWSNITYTYAASKPNTEAEAYKISCYTATRKSLINDDYHNTIYLQASINQCNASAVCSWNTYLNWPEGVQQYALYAQAGNGTPQLVYTGANTTFTYKNLLSNTEYQFFVRVYSKNGRSSTSNIDTLMGVFGKAPSAACITGINANSAQVSFTTDSASVPLTIVAMQSIDGITFTEASRKTVNYSAAAQSINNAYSSNAKYIKLLVISQCPNDTITTLVNDVINLQTVYDANGNATLQWNEVKPADAMVYYYYVFDVNANKVIDSVPFSNAKNAEYPLIGGTIGNCYAVLAKYNNGCSLLANNSNNSCINPETELKIPTGYSPNSSTPFKVQYIGAAPTQFHLYIYNRWGSVIFESIDINEGWYGTVDGKGDASSGTYVYYLSLVSSSGKPLSKSGIINIF